MIKVKFLRPSNLSIYARLLIALTSIFTISLIGTEYFSYQRAQEEALVSMKSVAEQIHAVLMATGQVEHQQFLASGLSVDEHTLGMLPFPLLSAIAREFPNWVTSGISFNNVSDRPLNPNNQADTAQASALQFFRDHPSEKMQIKFITLPDEKSFYHYSHPIYIKENCLKCHSKKEEVPAIIQKLYALKFDYKVGDVYGIMSIKIPENYAEMTIHSHFMKDLISHMFLFLGVFIVFYYILLHHVVIPLNTLKKGIQSVSAGDYSTRFVGLSGEFFQIGEAFNQMFTALSLDLSRRTYIENELKKRENLLANAQEIAHVGNCEWDIVNEKFVWSDEFFRILGFKPQEFIPLHKIFMAAVHPEDRDKIEQILKNIFENNELNYAIEYRIIQPNQSVRIVHEKVEVQRDEIGHPMRILGVLMDITELKNSEYDLKNAYNELRKNDYLLSSIINNMQAILFLKDLNGRYILINRQYEEVFQITSKQINGCTDRDIFPAEIADILQFNDRKVVRDGAFEIEEVILKKGEYRTYLSLKFPLLDAYGQVYAVGGIATDITERKNIEVKLSEMLTQLTNQKAHLRAILDNALDAIITINADGFVEAVNPAAESMFGYSKEFLIGKDISEYIIPYEFREMHKNSLIKNLKKDQFFVNLKRRVELPGLCASGKIIDLEVGLISVLVNGKKQYTAFMHDVTERKQLLHSLQETLAVAESANRMKSEFIANMSHEIRTPMNTIIGMTDIVLNMPLSQKEQKINLQIIQKSSQSLLELINSILDLSKIDAGMFFLELIPFDLFAQIENACETVAIKAHQKEIELYCYIAHDLSQILIGDSLRLKQIIINLVNNAIKFTEEGEVVIRIERAPDALLQARPLQTEEEIYLLFSISDTGIGIPEDKQSLIFSPFTQGDGSTTRKYGGSGLGLTICKHLVAMMDGDLWLESVEGRGSTFYFTARLGLQKSSTQQSVVKLDSLAGVRVVLADSHPTGRNLVREIFSLAGASITESDSLVALLDLLEHAQGSGDVFDLLLLDDGLLQIDSPDFIKLSSHIYLFNKVILMLPSNVGIEKISTVVWLEGAISVRKPVHKKRLLNAVYKILGREPLQNEVNSSFVRRTSSADVFDILLVEDAVSNQQMATTILEKAGHTVTLAQNGREAILQLQKKAFDLVLMDIQMPHMDGLTATQQIRTLGATNASMAHVPIIAVTANVLKEEEISCLNIGMNGFLRKPYLPQQLLDIIDSVMNESKNIKNKDAQKNNKNILKNVDLEPLLFVEKSALFIAKFPNYLEEITSEIKNKNALKIIKIIHWFNETAQEIGAWKVAIQGMRLRGLVEQESWENVTEGVLKLESSCQEATQAILDKEASRDEHINRG
ncbi:MAG: PAS domain S-box protein [Magnetococcus sp. DMHC-6]